MFYVVHVEKWFQTIPANWVDKINKIIYWPTEKKSMLTMIKKEVPYKSDWKKYKYACLFGPFESYEDSKNFEKQCTGYSSQDEKMYEQYTSNNKLSQKRSRKRNPKYDKTDSEQSSESEDDNPRKQAKTKHTDDISKLQPLPSSSNFVPIDDNVDLEKETELLPAGPVQTNPIIISFHDQDDLQLDTRDISFNVDGENNINIPNVPEGTSQTVITTPKTTKNVNYTRSNIGCMNCCPCIGKINRKLDVIIHHMESKNGNDTNNNSTRQENVELFVQLETKEEFDEFEKLLATDAKKREQFRNVIKQEGGKNIGEHIRRTMKRLMTDDLAVQYSWSGQKNTIRFKDLLTSKLILNSVASLHPLENKKTMEDAIQSWLNHASDRKKKGGKNEDQRELLIEILIS